MSIENELFNIINRADGVELFYKCKACEKIITKKWRSNASYDEPPNIINHRCPQLKNKYGICHLVGEE